MIWMTQVFQVIEMTIHDSPEDCLTGVKVLCGLECSGGLDALGSLDKRHERYDSDCFGD